MMKLIIAPVLMQAKHIEMTGEGWLFMAGAWLFILTLTFYTFSKVLKKK